MPRHVALLRAVNVGSQNQVPMARLRALCSGLGWTDVDTYIQSGNVLFNASGARLTLETMLEEALLEEFGCDVPCMVRTAAEWSKIRRSNPFSEATASTPNLVMMGISKSPLKSTAAATLIERGRNAERVAVAGGVLWMHYAGGAGRSGISPGLLDRAAGSPVTTRNARTVDRLAAMLKA